MKKIDIDKKIILLAFMVLIFFTLLVMFLINNSLNNKELDNTAKQYHQIVIKNNLAEKADFSEDVTKGEKIKMISSSLSYIKLGLRERGDIIKYDNEVLNSSFSQIELLISKEKYKESLELTKKTIKEFNKALEKYKTSYKEDILGINKVLDTYLGSSYEAANYTIEGSWAAVTLIPNKQIPKEIAPDPAFVILKKKNDLWEKIFGPGTYFDEKTLTATGVPQNIIKSHELIKKEDQLNPLVY